MNNENKLKLKQKIEGMPVDITKSGVIMAKKALQLTRNTVFMFISGGVLFVLVFLIMAYFNILSILTEPILIGLALFDLVIALHFYKQGETLERKWGEILQSAGIEYFSLDDMLKYMEVQ